MQALKGGLFVFAHSTYDACVARNERKTHTNTFEHTLTHRREH